jgi:hypothetical protein
MVFEINNRERRCKETALAGIDWAYEPDHVSD